MMRGWGRNCLLDGNNQTFDFNSFGKQLHAMHEQHDSQSPQWLISGIESQPASNLQCIIEIEDQDGDDDDDDDDDWVLVLDLLSSEMTLWTSYLILS
jgi:hypothetical protein